MYLKCGHFLVTYGASQSLGGLEFTAGSSGTETVYNSDGISSILELGRGCTHPWEHPCLLPLVLICDRLLCESWLGRRQENSHNHNGNSKCS